MRTSFLTLTFHMFVEIMTGWVINSNEYLLIYIKWIFKLFMAGLNIIIFICKSNLQKIDLLLVNLISIYNITAGSYIKGFHFKYRDIMELLTNNLTLRVKNRNFPEASRQRSTPNNRWSGTDMAWRKSWFKKKNSQRGGSFIYKIENLRGRRTTNLSTTSDGGEKLTRFLFENFN